MSDKGGVVEFNGGSRASVDEAGHYLRRVLSIHGYTPKDQGRAIDVDFVVMLYYHPIHGPFQLQRPPTLMNCQPL